MAIADWGSRSPCTEGAHEDFIPRNNEVQSTVKSLRVKQLDDIGSVDHFYDFWIQKSHNFDDFWIQKCFEPYLQFLDPETAVFLQFLDPEIGPFLQFLNPEVFWSIFTISGSRNCSISVVYGSRNSIISTISGYKHSFNFNIFITMLQKHISILETCLILSSSKSPSVQVLRQQIWGVVKA